MSHAPNKDFILTEYAQNLIEFKAWQLSQRGDFTARFEAELDQRITQRLILQPRAEFNLAAQDVPQLGIGAGLDTVEVGIRLFDQRPGRR